MAKRNLWFWGTQVGPWTLWGLWWQRRWFLGFSITRKGEDWTLDGE